MVQTVFCPTRSMLEIQLNSMRSLYGYLRQYAIQADVCFTGFIDDEYYDEFVTNIKKLFQAQRCSFIRFNRNYGKAYVVNEAVKKSLQQKNNYKYLLTCDSDICFENNQPHLLERLIELSEKASHSFNKPFGLIACNFTGDNVHWLDRFENRLQINNEVISWPSLPGYPGGGIAGGCIFVSLDTWLKVGGYRTVGVYAPDDGFLMIDVHEAGYFICVAETLFVHHPGSRHNPRYQKWKEESMQQFALKLKNGAAFDFASDVTDCDNFWEQAKLIENEQLAAGRRPHFELKLPSSE